MGKMKGDIYKYYMLKYDANDPDNSSPKLPKWECRFCSKQYVQNATKMRHHVLNMCEEIPAPLKLALLDIPNVSCNNEDSAEEDTMTNSSNSSASATFILGGISNVGGAGESNTSRLGNNSSSCKNILMKPPLKKRKTLALNLTTTTSSSSSSASHSSQAKLAQLGSSLIGINNPNGDSENIWDMLARAIYASGAPLDMLENPFWIDVFQRISPGLVLPTANHVAKDLLEREEAKIRAEVDKHVQNAQYVGIQCESWFTKRGESMTTFVVTTPSPFSYKTYQTGRKDHNGSLIADKAIECIRNIEDSGPKILSFVSSAADNMKNVLTKIHQDHPDVLTFECVIESLESLFIEILHQKEVGETLQVVKTVVTKLKRSPIAKRKFDEAQLQINDKVRKLHGLSSMKPISYLVCLQSMLNVQNALRWLAMDDESVQAVGHELSLLVRDVFWTKVDLTLKILFPVIKWLRRMKDIKPEISLVAKAFSEIATAFDQLQSSVWQNTVYPVLLEKLLSRKELSMHDVHLAANLLDPRELGACLSQDQILQATEFIDGFSENHGLDSSAVITELSQFRMKSDFYSKPFLWKVTEKIQGAVWWSTMAPKSQLAVLAAAILNIYPATFKMDSNFTTNFFNAHHDSQDNKRIYVSHNLRISTALSVRPASEPAKRSKLSSDSTESYNEAKSSSFANGTSVFDQDYIERLCNQSDTGSECEAGNDDDDDDGIEENGSGDKVQHDDDILIEASAPIDVKLTAEQARFFASTLASS